MAFDAASDVSDEALMALYANGDRPAALALTQRVPPASWPMPPAFWAATGPRPRMWRKKPCCGFGASPLTGGKAKQG